MSMQKVGLVPQEVPEDENVIEVRCTGGCGRLLCDVSPGAIDPGKQDIRCEKCMHVLRPGEWHRIKGRPAISIAVYRCPGCNVIYEKVFEGIGRHCKKCHTHRYVFVATNANPPVIIGSRSIA